LGGGGWRSTALIYLGAFSALPVIAVVTKGFGGGLVALRDAFAQPGAGAAIRLTVEMAVATAVVNGVFGTLLAYVLVRFRFPGRGALTAVVDLPFAVPTLVTGVMLVALYGPHSPVGGFLERRGIHVIFAQPGILLALLFVTLPLVVRTVEPVLLELDVSEEEAARVLGANGWATFRRVVLPALRPAIAAGMLLTFARALGEFGAIIVVSGNLTGRTLTAPVFIFQLTSQFRSADCGGRGDAAVRVVVRAGDRDRTPGAPAQGRPVTRGARWTMLGLALAYVTVLLLAPLVGILWTAVNGGFHVVTSTLSAPDVRHAYLLSGVIAVLTVLVTTVLGTVVAVVLTRDRFPGRRLLSALVDMPLAISPIIVGLMAVLLFGRGGWFESFFAARGVQVIFALPSMVLGHDLHLHPVRRPGSCSGAGGARDGGGGRGPNARRVVAPDVPPGDAAEHPVGPAVRDRAVGGPGSR